MTNQRANQLVEAGLWLRLSGDVEGAKKLFEQALELDPENSKARELIDAPMTTVFPSFESQATKSKPDQDKKPPPAGKKKSDLGAGQETEAKKHKVEFTELEAFDFGEQDSQTEATSPNQAFNEVELGSDSSVGAGLDTDWGAKVNTEGGASNAPGEALDSSSPGNSPALDALELVDIELVEPLASKPPSKDSAQKKDVGVQTLLKGAQDLLELDDHTGAMELILKAQELAPNDPSVRRMREKSEKILQTMFESKLGAMSARPRVVLKEDEIIWLNLDHRSGFVLAQIDGSVTFEDLFAVSGMSRLDTARILAQLVDEGVIKV